MVIKHTIFGGPESWQTAAVTDQSPHKRPATSRGKRRRKNRQPPRRNEPETGRHPNRQSDAGVQPVGLFSFGTTAARHFAANGRARLGDSPAAALDLDQFQLPCLLGHAHREHFSLPHRQDNIPHILQQLSDLPQFIFVDSAEHPICSFASHCEPVSFTRKRSKRPESTLTKTCGREPISANLARVALCQT